PPMPPTASGSPHESTLTLTDGGRAMTVERFDPERAGPAPAVVLLHGADGLTYRGSVYRAMARYLSGRGMRVFLPHYFERAGTPGRASFDRPLEFLGWMDAVGLALNAAGPGPTGLIGVSLGAYLALAAAGNEARVGAVVAVCGGLPAIRVG